MRCSVLFWPKLGCSVLPCAAALNLGAPTEKFEVVAVADKLETRRDQAQAELGCEVYDDWRKMLAAGARFSPPALLEASRAPSEAAADPGGEKNPPRPPPPCAG